MLFRSPITDLVTPIRTGYQEYDISDTGRSGRNLTLTLTDTDGMPTQGWEVDARLGWGIRPDRARLIVQHLTTDEENMPEHGMDYREILDRQMAIIGSSARFDAITGLDADTVLRPDGRDMIANRANEILSATLADAPWGGAVILGRMRFGQFVQPEERAERLERLRRMKILQQERDTVGSYVVEMEMAKNTRNVTLIRLDGGNGGIGGSHNRTVEPVPAQMNPLEYALAISRLSLDQETKALILKNVDLPDDTKALLLSQLKPSAE